MNKFTKSIRTALFLVAAVIMAGCSSFSGESLEAAPTSATIAAEASPDYLIGPLDQLEIFVWRAPELSTNITVRPDGRISTPLVEDMVASGKTPSILARDLESALRKYVKSPEVTVIVSDFSSTFDQQVRVLGEAQEPVALPYHCLLYTSDAADE